MKRFKSQVHLACGNDTYRPAFTHIHFKNGYLYATCSRVLIKQSLKDNGFDDEEIKILNGKRLHKEMFKELLRMGRYYVQEDGFLCFTKQENKLIIPFSEEEFKDIDFEAVIPKGSPVEIDGIGVNVNIMQKLNKIALGSRFKMNFYGKTKVIVFKSQDYDETILLTSVTFND